MVFRQAGALSERSVHFLEARADHALPWSVAVSIWFKREAASYWHGVQHARSCFGQMTPMCRCDPASLQQRLDRPTSVYQLAACLNGPGTQVAAPQQALTHHMCASSCTLDSTPHSALTPAAHPTSSPLKPACYSHGAPSLLQPPARSARGSQPAALRVPRLLLRLAARVAA